MSYCINPDCPYPEDPANTDSPLCCQCGSQLLLLDRYRVVSLLSDSSGFANIYEVQDGQPVKILKTLKQQHNSNTKAVELFVQEATVLSQLDHTGIPKIDSQGYFQYFPRDRSQPVHCFIMEKIDGPNLKEWMLQQGNLLINERQALDWLKQITEILHLVHRKNYFHRDIKLQNIMLRSTGRLVLIDFGTAREMTYTYLARMGHSGNVTKVSSAGYTPPEQQQGHAVPQSDFYALGRTFIYLLTGKQLEDKDIYDPYTNEFYWRRFAPDISPEFANFIDKLMAYRAIDRPTDTREILETIDRLQKFTSGNKSRTQLERLPVTQIQLSPDSPTVPQEVEVRQNKWLLSLIILALLVIVGGYSSWQGYQYALPFLAREGRIEKGKNIPIAKTLTGHTSFINDLAISPDSRLLISASADKTIKVWELETGKLLKTLTGNTSFVNALAITFDGNFLIAASADKTIRIWNLETGAIVKTLNRHTSFVDAILMSSDGQILVSTGADKTIRIWNIETGEMLHVLQGHSGFVNALAISSDGETLVSGSADASLKVWSLKTGKELRSLLGHSSFINAIAISPNGTTLASGGADETIKIWDLQTGEEIKTLNGHTGFINDLAISPDGEILVSASADTSIRVWQLKTGKELYVLNNHSNYVNSVKISQDGTTLISSSADRTIKFWNLITGKELLTLTGYQHHINYFAISPDGRFVATGSGDKAIAIWKI
ncbi:MULTISPECIES: protein kinase [Spirulina sp. CCY15215]|uniref:protein kinase domain-containing protein n=1 Tax=Spirulina sp. CCY15215 TaxID=2767591 RepID=UPI00194E6D24|nr:protein kinase [Spirulina major]